MAARVLHLLSRHPDYQTQMAVAQLTRAAHADATSDVCTIGQGGDFGTALMAMMHLRQRCAGYDLIHAWGARALTVAAVGGGKRIVYSPTQFPARSDLRWLRAVMSSPHVQVVCPTETMRRRLVERGVPIQRCHLIRPGVDFSRVNRRRNDVLRGSLGFKPDDYVLLAVGESLRGANHHAAILAAAVLHVFDPKYKLLLWGHGPLAESELAYGLQMLPKGYMSVATQRLGKDASFEQLMAATDAALVTADGPVPTLPIAVSMAAGLPIVAVVSPTVAELLEDRHTALMVGRATSRLLARRVLDLQEDPQLQWHISDTARTEAYEYFSTSRFVTQFRAVYDQLSSDKAVEVPQQAPGAGLRFLGRV
jgi:glycosyltransferase involved in cell wall biosynthesis